MDRAAQIHPGLTKGRLVQEDAPLPRLKPKPMPFLKKAMGGSSITHKQDAAIVIRLPLQPGKAGLFTFGNRVRIP